VRLADGAEAAARALSTSCGNGTSEIVRVGDHVVIRSAATGTGLLAGVVQLRSGRTSLSELAAALEVALKETDSTLRHVRAYDPNNAWHLDVPVGEQTAQDLLAGAELSTDTHAAGTEMVVPAQRARIVWSVASYDGGSSVFLTLTPEAESGITRGPARVVHADGSVLDTSPLGVAERMLAECESDTAYTERGLSESDHRTECDVAQRRIDMEQSAASAGAPPRAAAPPPE
jgi:hypothetical protein